MSNMPNKNIEQAVLSAIIFEPSLLNTLAIETKDFFYPFNQSLFKTFKELEDEQLPIDDEFIKQRMTKNKTFVESEFVETLSASPISNPNAYVKAIKDATRSANFERELSVVVGNKEFSAHQKSLSIKEISDRFESGTVLKEAVTLQELINEDIPVRPKYEAGIKFLDDVFGGFELGQLVTVTGQQEVGKTQLTNQILLNVAKGHKALTFSLEFNRAKLQKYMLGKKHYNLSNIYAITQEMVSGDIDEICQQIQFNYRKNDTKFVVIDSQIMLFDESKEFMTSENEITSFYRKLHKVANTLDIIIFIIATKSLSNTTNKGRGIEIFGSKKASHFADIQIDLSFKDDNRDSNNTTRIMWIGKNKQNGIHKEIELDFDKQKLEFVEKGKVIEVVYEQSEFNIKQKQTTKPKKDKDWNRTMDITIEDSPVPTEKELKMKEDLEKRGINFE